MKKILMASDLSPRSDRALQRSFALARQHGAALRVVNVVDEHLPAELREHSIDWARKRLANEIAPLSAATGVVADVTVKAGSPRRAIADMAAEWSADLLVLGIHDEQKRGKGLFGETTAASILKGSTAPVLLVTGDASAAYGKIVIGVDFSPLSRAALRQAVSIAPQAQYHLVHAYHVPFKGFLGSENVAAEIEREERAAFDAFIAGEMDYLAVQARISGVAPDALHTEMHDGMAASVLHTACSRLGADLLVMATNGRAGLSRAIWGSVARDLLDYPPCDVLVIKPY